MLWLAQVVGVPFDGQPLDLLYDLQRVGHRVEQGEAPVEDGVLIVGKKYLLLDDDLAATDLDQTRTAIFFRIRRMGARLIRAGVHDIWHLIVIAVGQRTARLSRIGIESRGDARALVVTIVHTVAITVLIRTALTAQARVRSYRNLAALIFVIIETIAVLVAQRAAGLLGIGMLASGLADTLVLVVERAVAIGIRVKDLFFSDGGGLIQPSRAGAS